MSNVAVQPTEPGQPQSQRRIDSAPVSKKRGLPTLSLKGRALRLLSGREYSRAELQRKLAEHEETPGELAIALDDLQAKGFISEQRVIESVINRRAAKLGAARIRQELQSKGLDKDAVQDAMAGLQASELARASEVWRKKFAHLPACNDPLLARAQAAKQIRYLAARGFGGETIRKVMADRAQEVSGFDELL